MGIPTKTPLPHKPKNFKGFRPFISGIKTQPGEYASYIAARVRSDKAWRKKAWKDDRLNQSRIGGTS